MRCIRIDLSKIFPMEPSELKISFSVKSYYEKTAKNYRNSYVAEKPIVFQLSKILVPNVDSTNWKAE